MTPSGEQEEISDINVTPFIDVMLVLLIIFMVAAPLSTVDIPVTLPQAAGEVTERPAEPVWITVDAAGAVFLGDAAILPDQIVTQVQARTDGKTDAPIYLRADRAADYGAVMVVLSVLQAGGYSRIALVGEEAAP